MPSIDEILYSMHSASMKDWLPLSKVQTLEEAIEYGKQGFNMGNVFTEQEFIEKFGINTNCVWYTNNFEGPIYYYNEDTLALCSLQLLSMHIKAEASKYVEGGIQYSGVEDPKEVENAIKQTKRLIESVEKEVAEGQFYTGTMCLNNTCSLEYIKKVLASGKYIEDGAYALFLGHYTESDYGCASTFTREEIESIVAKKTEEDKEATRSELEDLPEVLTVYRGGNSKSTPYNEAYSWTLDPVVANFFAARRGHEEGYIVKGTVPKEKVFEFFTGRNEDEVLLFPEDVTVEEVIPVLGVSYIEEVMPTLMPIYQKHRKVLNTLKFAKDSNVHNIEHEGRMLLLCLYLAKEKGLTTSDMNTLATAACYHDLMRETDGVDKKHGKASRENYERIMGSKADPVVSFLCEYHCLPDEEGYREINNNRKLSKNRTKTKLLFDIFKDSDALDRVRFGIKDVDLNQLRLDISARYSLVARILLEQLKVKYKEQ